MMNKTIAKAIHDVATERARQAQKWGAGELNHLLSRFTKPSSYGLPEADDAVAKKIHAFDSGEGDWVWILTAETARFARAAIDGNVAEARRFAVRIGAVAVAIVESIDGSADRDSRLAAPEPEIRSCNKHKDCDAADAAAREKGKERAYHCHADDCEECFGC